MEVSGAGAASSALQSKFDLGTKLIKQAAEDAQTPVQIIQDAAKSANQPSGGSNTANLGSGVGGRLDVSV